MKKKQNQPESEEDKELQRAYVNSFLSPDYDDHIPLVDESYFHKIYGKENYEKMKAERQKKTKEEKKRLGLI